jgi:hypothetical protein
MVKWRALVNTAMNLEFNKNQKKSINSQEIVTV